MLKDRTRAPFMSAGQVTIDKREKISKREFLEEYVKPMRPVVIKDAARAWKGMGKITPEYIRTRYGSKVKNINGVDYTYAQYVDLMLQSTPENPAPYPFSVNIENYLPELMAELKPDIAYGKIDRVNHPLVPRSLFTGTEVCELFLGGNGSFFPFLHVDLLALHTQITQLYGSKQFILYSPDQTKYLYPMENNPLISQVDIFHPDLNRFPLFSQARPIRFTLEEGESILFPTGWWHSTRITEPCISVGRVQVNAYNWNAFIREGYGAWKRALPRRAPLMWLYGKMLGPVLNLQEVFA